MPSSLSLSSTLTTALPQLNQCNGQADILHYWIVHTSPSILRIQTNHLQEEIGTNARLPMDNTSAAWSPAFAV